MISDCLRVILGPELSTKVPRTNSPLIRDFIQTTGTQCMQVFSKLFDGAHVPTHRGHITIIIERYVSWVTDGITEKYVNFFFQAISSPNLLPPRWLFPTKESGEFIHHN